jgi:predicted metal-dependent hydrolase
LTALWHLLKRIVNIDTESFTVRVQEFSVRVTRKAVKTVQLSVYPPDGRVKMTVPRYVGNDAIRRSIISRLSWLRKQRDKFLAQSRQGKREMVNGESIYWLGRRYRLNVLHEAGKSRVVQERIGFIDINCKKASTAEQREVILYKWYRERLKLMIPDLLTKWEPVVGVHADEWGVKRMKTRWGTCNPEAKRVWLNLELAKKSVNCIEYVLVHELVHLLERAHNARFKALLATFMPLWKRYRAELNQAPLADEEWEC